MLRLRPSFPRRTEHLSTIDQHMMLPSHVIWRARLSRSLDIRYAVSGLVGARLVSRLQRAQTFSARTLNTVPDIYLSVRSRQHEVGVELVRVPCVMSGPIPRFSWRQHVTAIRKRDHNRGLLRKFALYQLFQACPRNHTARPSTDRILHDVPRVRSILAPPPISTPLAVEGFPVNRTDRQL
jgi:hypothetical protein